jgi:hypothetical protein
MFVPWARAFEAFPEFESSPELCVTIVSSCPITWKLSQWNPVGVPGGSGLGCPEDRKTIL